jgi:molecular chaperone GrpE
MKETIRNFFRTKMNTEQNNTSLNEENINKTTDNVENTLDATDLSEVNETPKEEVEKTWEDKYYEVNEKHLRLYSEFDNFRKRNAKDRIELLKTASSDIITALLPVLDDFERAIHVMEKTDDIASVKEGVHLIHSKLAHLLQAKGLEHMTSKGEVFNPDFHEAITNLSVQDETMKGKVIDEVEKGYSLNGKVIRFAKVVVGN